MATTFSSTCSSYITYTLNATASFSLPRRFYVELSGWYYAHSYSGTSEARGAGQLSLGLKKELTRGSLQLAISDILRSGYYSGQVGTVAPDVFYTRSFVHYDSEAARRSIVRLTYSWALTGKNIGYNGKGM